MPVKGFFFIKDYFPAEFCNIQQNFTPAEFLPLPAKFYFVFYSMYFDTKGLKKKKKRNPANGYLYASVIFLYNAEKYMYFSVLHFC